MYALNVGETLPKGFQPKTPINLGGILTYDKDTFLISIFVDNPTLQELNDVREGVLSMSYVTYKDAIFLVLQIGRSLIFDLSFDANEVDPEKLPFPDYTEKDGAFVVVAMADPARSYRIAALRPFTLTPHMTALIAKGSQGALQKRDEDRYDFKTSYLEAMNKYPSPEHMIKDAQLTETCGRSFTSEDISQAREIYESMMPT